MSSDSTRRKFLGTAAGAAAFTIVPRHVVARSGEVPPSDKITLAYIGTGTQGLRELMPMLASSEIRVVSVCDACKNPSGYRDWSRDSLLRDIRRGLNKPDWRAGSEGVIPGGRDVGPGERPQHADHRQVHSKGAPSEGDEGQRNPRDR